MNDERPAAQAERPPQPHWRRRIRSALTNPWLIAFVSGGLFLGLSYLLTRLPTERPGLTCETMARSYGERLSSIVITIANSGERHLSDVKGSLTFSEAVKDYSSALLDDPAAVVTQSDNKQTLMFTVPEIPVGHGDDLLVLFDRPAALNSHDVTALHLYEHHGRVQEERVLARFFEKKPPPERERISKMLLMGVLLVLVLVLSLLAIVVIRRRRSDAMP